jgi:hypothetical protein
MRLEEPRNLYSSGEIISRRKRRRLGWGRGLEGHVVSMMEMRRACSGGISRWLRLDIGGSILLKWIIGT